MSERPGKGELETLQQTIRFFETLLRASADGIVITDAAQNIVVVNEAFCAFFGRRWRDVIETGLFVWLEQLDAGASERWIELEQRVRREGLCRDVGFQMQRPGLRPERGRMSRGRMSDVEGVTRDGVRHLSVNASLLERVADEERGVIISIWRDATARVRAEEALREAHDELEVRVEERTAELAKANEELRIEIAERVRAEEALWQRNRELELLNRAGQAFNSTLDLDQVLAAILDEVRHLLGVTACSAWLVDPETEELVCRQVTDPQSDIVRGWRLAPGQGLAGWVTRHGESLNVPDVRADERHYKGVDQQTGLPLRSILTVPLQASVRGGKEDVIGVLQAVHTEADHFSSTDMTLIESLASVAASAIENARLYARAQQEIAERKRAQEALRGSEAQIQASLREKEVLLKEIHHRVKNNLQVISSLLNLQAGHMKDEQIIEMLREGRNRVRSMALVHEKLYRSPDLARVDLAGYVRNLATHLFRSYRVQARGITLEIEVADVALGIDTAVPCGLILNELLSNALKHAFPPPPSFPPTGGDERGGEIRIGLRSDQGKFTLTMGDNGVGFPPDLDFRSTESLGMQLVIMLVEQLGGTIELERGEGTTFKIEFDELEYKDRS